MPTRMEVKCVSGCRVLAFRSWDRSRGLRGSRGVRKAGCSTRISLVSQAWGQRVRKDHSRRSETELGTQREVDHEVMEGEVKICW